ncbi:hypothetical protein LOTGIDRAFT_165411 [Lottia gigantea]|uniref:Uncharacterized protein n=1 Tax=Lottia gigantea TaxID=225164 RepID=V3ZW68_LOTGI|nr:hypothetical protein LOTGIDRAFT_165411 [Lottia gigantea]ESO88627.1 hypothetical protein LOTGIDRAFT_165411 [Lottia gigantea]
MNNFSITNLKSPENDNDAVHKKYLREQINSIEVNKNHLEDKISNVKRFFKRQLNNKNFVNDTKLQQEVQRIISFIQKELVNVANKTELRNLISLISKLEDKIAKQKLDIQQLIDNIPDENEDTFQQKLNALETKLNSELQKELTNIKKQIQNIDDSEIKTYIQQQIQNIDDSEIKTYIHQQIQNIDDSVKIDSIFFRQESHISHEKFNARKVLQFINDTKNVETKELEINDENTKSDHLYEIKTSGKYIDRFRMLIIADKEEDEFILSDIDMILETESPVKLTDGVWDPNIKHFPSFALSEVHLIQLPKNGTRK